MLLYFEYYCIKIHNTTLQKMFVLSASNIENEVLYEENAIKQNCIWEN